MVTVSLELLRKANHTALMQAGNEAYMQLFTAKIQLEVESASKEYVHNFFNHIYANKSQTSH